MTALEHLRNLLEAREAVASASRKNATAERGQALLAGLRTLNEAQRAEAQAVATARAYLASPPADHGPTVADVIAVHDAAAAETSRYVSSHVGARAAAERRWQEVPPEVRRWVYNTMLPHMQGDRWDAGLTAAVALLAAVAGDEGPTP